LERHARGRNANIAATVETQPGIRIRSLRTPGKGRYRRRSVRGIYAPITRPKQQGNWPGAGPNRCSRWFSDHRGTISVAAKKARVAYLRIELPRRPASAYHKKMPPTSAAPNQSAPATPETGGVPSDVKPLILKINVNAEKLNPAALSTTTAHTLGFLVRVPLRLAGPTQGPHGSATNASACGSNSCRTKKIRTVESSPRTWYAGKIGFLEFPGRKSRTPVLKSSCDSDLRPKANIENVAVRPPNQF